VSPSQFYGTASSSTTASSSKPPPLPTRTQNPGSARTVYHPPSSPPPSYARAETSPFREPELIIEEPVSSMNDNIPDLIPQEASWYPPNTFEAQADWAGSGGPTWDGNANPWQPVPGEWPTDGYDATGYTTGAYASRIVDIDGRDLDEETAWWNAEVRDARMRPGPGILPPVLTDLLHDSEHSLLSVIVTPPDIRPREPRVDPSAAPSDAPQPQPPPPPPPAAAPPPSDDEVHTAIPHPHAYYCRRHNGWVIVAWKSSLVLPPLAKSFLKNNARPSHDQARRKKRLSCVGHGDQPSSQANKTHHFHVYEKAVDAHKLNPPFHRSGWEKEVKIKAKRRKATISLDEVDLMRLKNLEEQVLQDEEDEGDLLDLYICCQCSMYCVASEVIPGVIPIKYVEEFTREKLNNPQPGRTGQMAVALGWDTFLKSVYPPPFYTGAYSHLRSEL
jgi:ubiquitin carboxyl-terminal hydrolase 25/28